MAVVGKGKEEPRGNAAVDKIRFAAFGRAAIVLTMVANVNLVGSVQFHDRPSMTPCARLSLSEFLFRSVFNW